MTTGRDAAAGSARPVAVRSRGWGWRHGTRQAWAVRGLDLDVPAGQRVLLLGASGAGKSTLLQGLAGLLDPENGDEEGLLDLDGVPARRARTEGVAEGLARTGLLLQDPLSQTVLARCGDDVAFGLENHAVPVGEIWPRVTDALASVGFPYPLGHPTSRLSGGERQRLALAGVLALRPGLLLLDEPTAMLDPAGAAALRERVGELLAGSGATCVLVEHRVGPWLPFVDRVVVLAPGGGVRADGAPDDVLAEHGAELAAEGVWVPQHPPRVAPRRGGDVGAPLLSAAGVAVSRPHAGRPAVAGVDVTLRAGGCTAVVGPNGAGKSTLALALSGLAAPVAGTVTAHEALADGAGPQPHRWRARDLAARIGTVFQEPAHQFVAATVTDELAVGLRRTGADEQRTEQRVEELLQRLRLGHLAGANPFTLSGGEQRRLSVATVLAAAPGLLVLDEPTFGQDSRTWAELVGLLGELLDDGVSVCAVTHDDDLVRALADDVLRLADGGVVA